MILFIPAQYAKAVENVWKHDKFKNTINRMMGVFHTLYNFSLQLRNNPKMPAELRGMCVEAGVIAEGPVAGGTEGHKYNDAIRLDKLVNKALVRLTGFLPWLEDNNAGEVHYFNKSMKSVFQLTGWCISKSIPGLCTHAISHLLALHLKSA